MRVAFGTVVYESAYRFHKDFIDTINSQDAKDFDVLIVNDDLDEEKFDVLINNINRNVISVKCDENSSIQETRIKLIETAKKNNYDLLILGDFDDIFSQNRVSMIASSFDFGYSFFYNDLYYYNSDEKFFQYLPSKIENINQIYECNFLGLSNTSINLNTINSELLKSLYEKQTKAFDWMIYSLLLLSGNKGKKVEGCGTFYRIHDCNIAGESDTSLSYFKKEIEIKINHYTMLKKNSKEYSVLLDFYCELLALLETDSNMLLDNIITDNDYWWGKINKKNFKEINQ